MAAKTVVMEMKKLYRFLLSFSVATGSGQSGYPGHFLSGSHGSTGLNKNLKVTRFVKVVIKKNQPIILSVLRIAIAAM